MDTLRVALILMTVQRYFSMALNFAMVAIVSRLLRPEEIGLAVIGTTIAALAVSAREFAALTFLVQKKDLTAHDVRAAFSVLVLVTGIVSAGLIISAPWIASEYAEPMLVPFLHVVSVALIVELIAAPVVALLQRNMRFGKVALITTLQIGSSAVMTVWFAMAGLSSMSYAWAWLVSATMSGLIALYLWRDYSIYRPVFSGWREMLTFGGYNGANQFLYRVYESVPYIVLGRIVSMHAVGLYNRAMTICQLPDKVFLSGIIAVALPAFSARAREAGSLKAPYLRGVSYITAVMWPAQVIVAILAHPIILVLLGSQWTGAVPVVQIVALAFMFAFSAELNYPVLIAMGAIRATFTRALIAWPISTVALCLGAFVGLKAMALSLLFAVPFQAVVSIFAVQNCIELKWSEIFAALKGSILVTLITAAGPLAVVASAGLRFDLSIPAGLGAGMLAAVGWLLGLWLTRHPLAQEIANSATLLRASLANR